MTITIPNWLLIFIFVIWGLQLCASIFQWKLHEKLWFSNSVSLLLKIKRLRESPVSDKRLNLQQWEAVDLELEQMFIEIERLKR